MIELVDIYIYSLAAASLLSRLVPKILVRSPLSFLADLEV